MTFKCPVCFYDQLPYPPDDYHICLCCGTEFGNDDQFKTHEQLRSAWIARGAPWFFRRPPEYWNPWVQLIEANHANDVPKFVADIRTSVDLVVDCTTSRIYSGFSLAAAA